MSNFSHDPIRIQPALDRGDAGLPSRRRAHGRTPLNPPDGGERRWRFNRPFASSRANPPSAVALGDPAPRAMATLEEREFHALLSRTRMVARLLVEMRSHLDAKGLRALLDAAKRVVEELATALSLIVARASTIRRRTLWSGRRKPWPRRGCSPMGSTFWPVT